MRWVAVFLLALLLHAPAFAGIRFCSNFPHPVRFAIAYDTPDGMVSEGWVDVAPETCVDDTKHAGVLKFIWTAESVPYKSNGDTVKTTWGKGKEFAVKNGNFALKHANSKSKGARLAGSNGPISFSLPEIVATIRIEADASSTTTIPGPNSVLNSNPDFKTCANASGEEALVACDRGIASGKFTGDLLAELYNNRGVERQAKNDLDGAMSDYNEALKLNGKYAFAHNNRGRVLFDKKDYAAAVAEFSLAIEIDPKMERAYSRRGDSYKLQKSYDKAIDDYKTALTLNPPPEKRASIESVLADTYVSRGFRQKSPDAALADYNEALKYDPNNIAALNNRAVFYAGKGDYDRAIQDLDQAIKIKPDYAMALRNRGDAYRDKGDKDKAIADYKQALANNPSDALRKEVQAALDKLASGASGSAPASAKPEANPSPSSDDASDVPDLDQGQVDFRDQ